MNNKFKIFFFLLSIFLSFLISILFWKNISLSYSNLGNVVGYYSINNFSEYNNLLRFIFFIGFPILIFFILFKNFFYKNVNLNYIFLSEHEDKYKVNDFLIIILIISLLISSLNYLSIDLISNSVDYFHEGLTLSMAFNFYKTGLFWDGSYLANSLFSDILSATIPWEIFNHISIGSYKVFHYFLRYLTEIFLIFFIYKLSFVFDLKKNTQNIFFITIIFISLKLNRDLTEIFYPFRYRDIPIFILLYLAIDFIKFQNHKIITPFLLGVFSSFSILWSLDRGIYYFISLVILISLALIKKRYFSSILLLSGMLLSCLLIYLYFGHIEFKSFLYNSLNVLKDFDLVAGSPYPTIFDFDNKHSSRGTFNLIIIILNGFLISFLFLNQKINLTNNSKLFLLFFFIVSCLIYKSALSVPAGYHMKQSIFFSKIFMISNLLYILIYKNFFDNIKKLKFVPYILLVIIVSKSLVEINYSNVLSFKERNLILVKKEDDFFLQEKYINLRNVVSNNYDLTCIQLFSYDVIMPYLLRKKNCTKFNFLYVISSNDVQNKMIDELKNEMPNFIFFNQKYDFLYLKPVEKRFQKIAIFINKNYTIDRQINNWNIYKRK